MNSIRSNDDPAADIDLPNRSPGASRQLHQFALALHSELQLDRLAYQLANQAVDFADCDRVAVAVPAGKGQYTLAAVSGVSEVHTRSDLATRLLRVMQLVARYGETVVLDTSQMPELPPDLQQAWSEYQDTSADRMLTVIPLSRIRAKDSSSRSDAPLPCGILALSHFHRPESPAWHDRLTVLTEHSAVAMDRAVSLRRIYPAVAFLQYAVNLLNPNGLGRRLMLTATLAIMAALPWIIQRDHYVLARGHLAPTNLQHIYAPEDGVVDALLVHHGQQVAAGEPVLQLRSHALELDAQRVAGDLLTARERLSVLSAGRLASRSAVDNQSASAAQLSADELEVRSHIENLERQSVILGQQRDHLRLASPCTGSILTWDPEQLLRSRPVQRGQRLLTVADLAGAWHVELDIPDRRVGYVRAYAESSAGPNRVKFVTAAAPDLQHTGRLTHLASTADSDPVDGVSIRGIVATDASDWPLRADTLRDKPIPGVDVVARIHCGRRTLGFIWLHEFYEELLRRFF